MALSVAYLTEYYADNPPPAKDPLAELEARLDALSKPGYRSPFKFEPSLGVGPFGTTGYRENGTYGSVSEFLKATIPDVASLYRTYPAGSMGMLEPTPLSELLAKNYKPSPGLIGAAKVAYDAGSAFNRALVTWRPAFEGLGSLMQRAALGLPNADTGLRRWMAEAERRTARKKAMVEDLLLRAYQAVEHIGRNRPEKARDFMRREFNWEHPSMEHLSAFWEALQVSDAELREGMMLAPDPKAWLAARVAFRMRRARRERDSRDLFFQKHLSPDQERKLRGAGHKQHETEGIDPGLIVARKYDLRRQVIEEISSAGRPISQERAEIVRACLDLGLDDEECRNILGEDDAWRAFKTTAINERENFEKDFKKSIRNRHRASVTSTKGLIEYGGDTCRFSKRC